MMERNLETSDSDVEFDESGDGQRGVGIRETLLVDDRESEPSVTLRYLLALTCGVGGLQVVWSVILSNGSVSSLSLVPLVRGHTIFRDPALTGFKPFLVSLGLSKSLTALVWVAAPLCGVIVQPLVGSLSDRTRSRWGRRRPFIVGGAIGVIIAMLALAWVEEILGSVTKAPTRAQPNGPANNSIIFIAIFWIYALNIFIQPLQAGLRTLIIENCPAHQQTQASAWASGMTGVGNIVGYLSGFTPLPNIFSKHLSQIQCLCLIASFSLMGTGAISCSIKERNSPHAFPVRLERTGLGVILRDLVHTYRSMPKRVRKVCHIQVFAWMGWFPFLFYSTTYVGEFYAGRVLARQLPVSSKPGPHTGDPSLKALSATSDNAKTLCAEAVRFGTFASFLFAVTAFLTNIALPTVLKAFNKGVSPLPETPPRLSIPRAWACAHTFFALAMFATFFVTTQATATFIVAFAGLSWALTLWAPFAIIGNELAYRQSLQESDNDIDGEETSPTSTEVQAGAIMGLHNVAISAPQIVSALACSGIFGLAKLAGSHYGTGWVLRAGGCAALVAAYLTYRPEE